MHKTDVDKLLGKNPPRRRKILLEFAKQPSGVANRVMAETLHIDHSDLENQHLSAFEEFGVIRKCDVVVKRPMGRVRTPTEINMKGHRLNHGTNALHQLVAAFNHDPDSQHKFMLSQYYRSLIPEIVEEFKSLMPSYIDEHVFHSFSTQYEEKIPIYAEKDDPLFYSMWLCRRSPLAEGESLKHALTAFKIDFTEVDENCLAESLKHNWLTLKYVMLCISITDEERERMILQIWFAANDSRLSPSAARKDGWLTALDSVGHLISKKAEYVTAYDSFYDAVRSEPSINWIEFFCQLDHFNSAYRFLM